MEEGPRLREQLWQTAGGARRDSPRRQASDEEVCEGLSLQRRGSGTSPWRVAAQRVSAKAESSGARRRGDTSGARRARSCVPARFSVRGVVQGRPTEEGEDQPREAR